MNDNPSGSPRPGLAAAFALCAIATLILLATHPNSGTGSLPDFLKDAAHHQYVDGIVHGGFIITLATLIVCFVFLCRCLGSAQPSVVVGLTSFCIGSGALMASMVLDGFVVPGIGVRFAGTQSADDLLVAKTLVILLGTLIRFLMPIGVLLQFGAMFSWSLAVVRGYGLARAVGAFGLIAALTWIITLVAAPARMATHVLLGGIMLLAIWYGLVATVLFRGDLCSGRCHST